MSEQTPLAVSIKYESRTIFRNVRPLTDILEDFEQNNIRHLQIDPNEMKYGSWDLVIAFTKQENYELFKAGNLSLETLFEASDTTQKMSTNPLKMAKRAASSG